MKINCNIIGDLLPLYADDVISEDAREMVEEHLAYCVGCREKYEDIKRELGMDEELSAAQAEKLSIISAKKKLKKKRIMTAIFSLFAGALILWVIIIAMNYIKIPLPYEEERFEVSVREEGGEECLFLRYTGKIHGHEMVAISDSNSGEEEMYIELYTTPWRNLFGGGEDNTRYEIFCGTLGLGGEKIKELRYIAGDCRQLYSPTRDYETLEDASVLLWEREEGSVFRAQPDEGVNHTQ